MRRLSFVARFLIPAAGPSLIPAAAWACPACMVGDPKTAATYFGMTVVMSSLPILLVCGIGYWLWRRYS
jgi:hypothetical protein